MGDDWRGVVNGVAYCVQFDRRLDEAVVERVSRILLRQPLYGLDREAQYQALLRAVGSAEDLSSRMAELHGSEDMRDFLRRLAARMDALRPWPAA